MPRKKQTPEVSLDTPKPAPAEAQPKPENVELTQQPRQLTPHQKMLADICGHLILTGGFNDDLLNQFLLVLFKDDWGRSFHRIPDLNAKDSQNLWNRVAEWKRLTLREAVDEPELNKPERFEDMGIEEYVRTGARYQLQWHLQMFLDGATPEEVYFLNDVMSHWDGYHGKASYEQVGIAHSMTAELPGLEQRYFVVPERHQQAVDAYLGMLLESERKLEAKK